MRAAGLRGGVGGVTRSDSALCRPVALFLLYLQDKPVLIRTNFYDCLMRPFGSVVKIEAPRFPHSSPRTPSPEAGMLPRRYAGAAHRLVLVIAVSCHVAIAPASAFSASGAAGAPPQSCRAPLRLRGGGPKGAMLRSRELEGLPFASQGSRGQGRRREESVLLGVLRCPAASPLGPRAPGSESFAVPKRTGGV